MAELIVLALNSGSSSLKFGLFRWRANSVGALMPSDTLPPDVDVATIARVITKRNLPAPTAVGHQIVHGGPGQRGHFVIEDDTLGQIEQGKGFTPLHTAATIGIIVAARSVFPDVPHVACLDTVFHGTLPEKARTLPIDAGLSGGIERSGFHGLSCSSIVRQLGAELPERLIVAHLGSGASVTAIQNGHSVDTSMGVTPTGGMMMATRSGDLDPGVLLLLMRERGLSQAEVQDLVDRRSGLLGVSGISGDLRELHRVAALRPTARVAITMFATAAAKQIAMMMVSLGGVDALVFTGGVGENDAPMRAAIVELLSWVGLTIDHELNDVGIDRVDAKSSASRIYVLPSNEQEEIVRIVAALMPGGRR